MTDSARTRSWSGDSKTYCVQDIDTASWHETCGKMHSAAFATTAERASCCSWQDCVRSQSAYFGDWDIIVLCIMFLVFCVFFNKCLCYIKWLGTFWKDLRCWCSILSEPPFNKSWVNSIVTSCDSCLFLGAGLLSWHPAEQLSGWLIGKTISWNRHWWHSAIY